MKAKYKPQLLLIGHFKIAYMKHGGGATHRAKKCRDAVIAIGNRLVLFLSLDA